MSPKPQQVPVAKLQELPSPDLLTQVLNAVGTSSDAAAAEKTKSMIGKLIDQLLDPGMVVKPTVERTIKDRIAWIDKLLSDQVTAIMHSAEFKQLEASWLGLKRLVDKSETGENMKIRFIHATKRDLAQDFSKASEFTESLLWKKIYADEYSQYGGDPFGILVGDYEFDKGPMDMDLLNKMSEVAAGSHAPFLAATAPQMFGMESFTALPDPRDLAKAFDKTNPENARWISFRDKEDSRYVGLSMPHYLVRRPYGKDKPADTFDFQEGVDGEEHDKYLWGNAAFLLAERMTDAFAKYGWCFAIRGPEGGGLVQDLEMVTFKSRETGKVGSKCPTEVLISDDRENELSGLGFIPLLNCKNTDYAAFFGANSAQKPRKYNDPDATANARLSSQLPYLMVASRIAHYLKVMCRDKVGKAMSATEVEAFLSRWLAQYVLLDDGATDEQKAKMPLREAQVQVIADPAKPGCYQAIAHIRPHFQVDEINVSLRLVATLPARAKK